MYKIHKPQQALFYAHTFPYSLQYLRMDVEGLMVGHGHNPYPPVNQQFAIENGPLMVDLPVKDGDFP